MRAPSRREVLLTGFIGAGLIAVAASVSWVSLPGTGALVNGGPVTVRGLDVEPSLVASALVIVAAVLAGMIAGRAMRIVSSLVLAASAVWCFYQLTRGLTDHSALLAQWQLAGPGRTLDAARESGAQWGPFGPVVGMIGASISLLGAWLLANADWRIKRRFERPAEVPGAAGDLSGPANLQDNGSSTVEHDGSRDVGAASERQLGDWEMLDQGSDPTLDAGPRADRRLP